MAEVLSKEQLDAAVASLPAWSAADGKLVRHVEVAEDSRQGLLDAISRVADDMNHHPDVEQSPGSVTFRLWTHSAGGVTAKDVDLATRIDQQLSGAGSDS